MTPQEKKEFEELKRTVLALRSVTDVPFIESMRRRLDVDSAVRLGINRASINDFLDVEITSPSNGQVLKYTTTGVDRWVNGTDNVA